MFVAGLMAVFETVKQAVSPQISIWRSHVVTIAFTTVLSTIASYFLMRKFALLNQHREANLAALKQVNEALRKSEARYRSLFERNQAGVFRSTPEGRFIECNEAFARMFGYAREELLNLPAHALYPGGKEEWEKQAPQFLTNHHLQDDEMCYRRKDGTRMWAIRNINLAEDESRQGIVEGTLIDVTERHQLEDRLRQSQKVEAIGRLAGGVAHDFNNLIAVIMGYCELAAKTLQQNAQAKEYMERIETAAERAASLTRQLLAFGRKQVLQPKIINLNRLLTNLDKMLRPLLGEDVEIVTMTAPKLGHVKADPGQIEQVVVNLVVNARDAMPHGGKLTLETANVELDQNYAAEHGTEPGSYVLLAVSDNGEGMTPETKSRIFEPFFTTKETGKGTGLGLSTVYGIIKQSCGHIWVYSEIGEGTTFKVYLPRLDNVEESVVESQPATTTTRGDETILLIEDDRALRDLARSVLMGYGYSVVAPDDLGAVRSVVEQCAQTVQLLVTDVVMPGINGREVAEMVLARNPRAQVLYMSGYTDNAIAQRGGLEEGTFFLPKPFTASALGIKVREALNRRIG